MHKNVEKMSINYSPNFNSNKRSNSDLKYIVFHYTGMKSENRAIKRLTSQNSNVSCHYFIKTSGEIIQMVPDLYIAWHAGISSWKKDNFLNKNSVGIEISNPGHYNHYKNFNVNQIRSIIKLTKLLKKKYKIKKENILGHSDIAPLRKKDPGEKFPWKKLSNFNIGKWYSEKQSYNIKVQKNKIEVSFFKNLKKLGYCYFSTHKRRDTDKRIIKSFQSHFLPNNITGKIDKKTLKISHLLTH